MFNRLCLEIQDDIKAVNAIKYKELFYTQEFTRDGTLVIGQPRVTPRVTVSIGIVDQRIQVVDRATPSEWSARASLNDEGRCVLELEDGLELETWQFRKKALDALFFER